MGSSVFSCREVELTTPVDTDPSRPKGIAERHHQLALAKLAGIAQRERRQILAVDLEHRQIGLAVHAHHLGRSVMVCARVPPRVGSFTSILRAFSTT